MSKTTKRIPNYQIDAMIRELAPFTNYNASIAATINENGVYRIVHWSTTILEYDTNTNRIIDLRVGYISQTTSALVGRILRGLPPKAVEAYLPLIVTKYDFNRVRKMLRV
jgi:hypothetical protein